MPRVTITVPAGTRITVRRAGHPKNTTSLHGVFADAMDDASRAKAKKRTYKSRFAVGDVVEGKTCFGSYHAMVIAIDPPGPNHHIATRLGAPDTVGEWGLAERFKKATPRSRRGCQCATCVYLAA